MTEPDRNPQFTTIDMSAEARRVSNNKNPAELAWVFSNKREFYLVTGDSAIYETSPDFL